MHTRVHFHIILEEPMEKPKYLILLIGGMVIIAAVMACSLSFFRATEPPDGSVTAEAAYVPDVRELVVAIKKADKLTLAEAEFTFPMKHEIVIRKNLAGFDSLWPDWTEQVELLLNGKVAVGCRLDSITADSISVDSVRKKVCLILPPVEILESGIDANNIKVRGQTGNHIFGDFHRELQARALKKAGAVMAGIYRNCHEAQTVETAKRNAVDIFRRLLAPLSAGYEVEVRFREDRK
jgi:hypothetical protein